ncbi:hypothetical protein DXG01_003844 [Tephrocybe rancida]|nr:hypothetical protein DXG01_003844 [Tephrocybe rancida]
MSEMIHDTVINLHSSDILKKLDAEFHKCYKDYKIPLVSLKNGSLLKGLRIVMTPQQAKSLESLRELLVTTDIDESEVINVTNLRAGLNAQAEVEGVEEDAEVNEGANTLQEGKA